VSPAGTGVALDRHSKQVAWGGCAIGRKTTGLSMWRGPAFLAGVGYWHLDPNPSLRLNCRLPSEGPRDTNMAQFARASSRLCMMGASRDESSPSSRGLPMRSTACD
jgi:hypothetical protein